MRLAALARQEGATVERMQVCATGAGQSMQAVEGHACEGCRLLRQVQRTSLAGQAGSSRAR